MKKSFLFFLIGSVVLGVISAQIVYSRYMINLNFADKNVYLLKIGSYDSEEAFLSNYVGNFQYLGLQEEEFYNVYVGVTTNLFNAEKIRSVYEDINYSVDIMPVVINNMEFISNLEEFDKLVYEVDSSNVISIMNVVLSNYEEIVLGK